MPDLDPDSEKLCEHGPGIYISSGYMCSLWVYVQKVIKCVTSPIIEQSC